MTIISNEHLVIVRTGGSILNLNSYNCQELGLARALTKKGLRVTIIMAGNKYEKLIQKVEGKEIQIYLLPFKSINQALSWFEGVETLMVGLKPTCIQIHEFGMLMSYRVVKWAKKQGIPCFLIQGSYRTTQKPIFKQLEICFNLTLGKYVLNNVKGIGCKTKMASDYIHHYNKRVTMPTYIGLDVEKFSDEKSIYKDWRNELGIENKKVLLYVGVLEERRNPIFLLDILSTLSDDYVLLIIGDGPLMTDVKAKIASEKLEKKCFLLGKMGQEYLPSIYQCADLFLLASDYEIYGMVILEAMYFGLPVLSTLTAGSETLIDSYKDGLIINNNDVESWRKGILSIVDNHTLLKNMKDNAKLKIKNELIWDKACERFIELYLN